MDNSFSILSSGSTPGRMSARRLPGPGIRTPGSLARRRRLLGLRRLALALCLAGIVFGLGLLALPEQRMEVIVPTATIARGRLVRPSDVGRRMLPVSAAQGFLTSPAGLEGCYTRITLTRGRPIPSSACSCVPPLRHGQTLVSLPTSLVPGSIEPGSRAVVLDDADRRGTAEEHGATDKEDQKDADRVSVIVWSITTGPDGLARVKAAVDGKRAQEVLDLAARGPVLLSPLGP